ncbi:uncharacterized protein Z518_02290 [Rhinocladiella mackenziei CBS 650.93]|uniref:Rhinocladiella mackenziei CBS 650.93 unplaced genomic scaffold supercont1.2, whole genome shotgun sequence n=1 Tax=Rhinocladiella mackenziei CBS 650.93 TaxID=1442369 RepID=A0A0D2FZC2_9EURO|nr:uncharacterized protein Z518_02290 [Rhinocladiella mackenziei CBS 650.93]KIX07637.1 hypothetical protein Z518_02290 [Rhinocladiella mackenziei CBS 650.93]
MFPGRPQLQYPLRDLCLDYMDFCIVAVKHLRRKPFANFFRFLGSSSLLSSLDRIKVSMSKSALQFEQEVELAHRQAQRAEQLDLSRRLAMSPQVLTPPASMLTPSTSWNSTAERVAFPITTIVDFQNYAFTGRTDVLDQIHEVFNSQIIVDRSDPACVLLHGIGGVGKTQTALQYAFTHSNDFDATFWVRAETDHSLITTYAAIARKLDLPGADGGLDAGRSVEMARNWLERTDRKWLLVFDNVESIHSLAHYWPKNSQSRGSVLITTQKSDFSPISKIFVELPLESLSSHEGADLVFNHLRGSSSTEQDKAAAATISELVGGLPLALVTVSGYIRASACSLAEYRANFTRSSRIWTRGNKETAGGYEKTLATVFSLALSELSTDASSLLNILAFLNPDSVPESIFRKRQNNADLDFLGDSERYIEMVRELRHRHLIKREVSASGERTLSLHRSLQWSILHRLLENPPHRTKVFHQAFTLIRQIIPYDPEAPSTLRASMYPFYETMVPQVLKFATLLRDIGTFLFQTGDWTNCRATMQSVDDILNAVGYDLDGRIRTDVEADLGVVDEWIGISARDSMMEHYRRSLLVRRHFFNSMPPERRTKDMEIVLWTGWTDVACGYLEREEFDKAELILENALKQYQRWDPDETELPYEHSKYYENMTWVRCWQGRYEEVLEYSRHGAELCERAAGSQSGWTLLYHFHTSHVLFNMGHHVEAIDASLQVLSSRLTAFGESHHFTIDSYYSTGAMHWEYGNLDEAELMLRKCLSAAAKSSWSLEHHARGKYVLSCILRDKRQAELLDEADGLEQEALDFQDRMIRDHPQILKQLRPEDGAVRSYGNHTVREVYGKNEGHRRAAGI